MVQIYSPKRKLAVFLPDLVGAGAQRVYVNLANGIADRGYSVDLVAVKAEGSYLEQVSSKVRLVDFKCSRALRSLAPLVRYLRTERPDTLLAAVHVNFVALWAKRLARVETRVVVSQHINATTYSKDAEDIRVRVETMLIRAFYPWADGIIAVSEGVAQNLFDFTRLTDEDVQVIHCPVIMPDMFEKKSRVPEHPWYHDGGPPIILSVGRLSEQKGYEYLLRAMARLPEQYPARLIILGEGDLRPRLEKLVEELGLSGRVDLPGFSDNPYAFMAHSRLYVMSSLFEGAPSVLVEALFCDLPIVSTDCPNGPAELLAGGKHGRLIPLKDVDALTGAIVAALSEVPRSHPEESWRPHEMDIVLDQYIDALSLDTPLIGSVQSQNGAYAGARVQS